MQKGKELNDSVAGTDEAGDTVKVEPEQTNQNTRACVHTYIKYIIYCIDIDGMGMTYDVMRRSRATLPMHHPGRQPDSQTVVALVEQMAIQVSGRPMTCVEGEWGGSSSQKTTTRKSREI